MGSFASAWKCPHCPRDAPGVLLPQNPIDLESLWTCSACEFALNGLEVAANERKINQELENLSQTDIPALTDFVNRYSTVLHGQHAFLISAKQTLSVTLGRYPNSLKSKNRKEALEVANLKVGFCREVLKVLKILETGIATRIGK